MANEEHLAILRQGVEVWNEWRQAHPEDRPDLSHATLNDQDLSGANLSHSYLIHGRFDRALLTNSDFSYASLIDAKLRQVDLGGADLRHSDFRRSDLKDARLPAACLEGAKLGKAILAGADLTGASLAGADLIDADLRGACLINADLKGAGCWHTEFTDAILKGADLSHCWIGWTIFGEVDLGEVHGLETIDHHAPSVIGIGSVHKSGGNIPESFLRGCGVPETFITFARSLVGKAIDFYSCFISFTETDDAFSERLHNDLQAAGVRCWRWKEDARWGKTLMRSIDEAVRAYDKLVVICSRQSLQAPAVIREIERALQKEDELARQGKDSEVLFPIRLDDFIFEWEHYRKADVLAKHVGDFCGWHEPESYRKQFGRLIRDLKAEAKVGS